MLQKSISMMNYGLLIWRKLMKRKQSIWRSLNGHLECTCSLDMIMTWWLITITTLHDDVSGTGLWRFERGWVIVFMIWSFQITPWSMLSGQAKTSYETQKRTCWRKCMAEKKKTPCLKGADWVYGSFFWHHQGGVKNLQEPMDWKANKRGAASKAKNTWKPTLGCIIDCYDELFQ